MTGISTPVLPSLCFILNGEGERLECSWENSQDFLSEQSKIAISSQKTPEEKFLWERIVWWTPYRRGSLILKDGILCIGYLVRIPGETGTDGKMVMIPLPEDTFSVEIVRLIEKAIACQTRKEVLAWLDYFNSRAPTMQLIIKKGSTTYWTDENGKRQSQLTKEPNYFIAADGSKSQVQIELKQWGFEDRNWDAQRLGHTLILKIPFTVETEEITSFVNNRNTFFQENYNAGQRYQHRPVWDLRWMLTLVNYWIERLMNAICLFTRTRYCDEFDIGRRDARNGISLPAAELRPNALKM